MSGALIYLVDDDEALRDSLSWLLRQLGHDVQCFATAEAFLNAFDRSRIACLVTDVRMPGMSGLELQETLARTGQTLPAVIITGHGDVPMTVRAMRAGALDVLEKPFNNQVLIERIGEALRRAQALRRQAERREALRARFDQLTRREREVAIAVARGGQNKTIAHDLGISQKTVEIHRQHAMEKMGATTGADLARLLIEAEVIRENP